MHYFPHVSFVRLNLDIREMFIELFDYCFRLTLQSQYLVIFLVFKIEHEAAPIGIEFIIFGGYVLRYVWFEATILIIQFE